MTSYSKITDHIAQALDRILFQYKNKPLIEGVFTALVKQVQEIEDALEPLVFERSVNTAIGAQLDEVGAIVGIARVAGQDDVSYRIAIKNKIIQNLNQGTPEEFIAAAKFFLNAAFVWYLEVYPAEVDLFTTTPIAPDDQDRIRALLENFLPIGVSLGLFGQYAGNDAFIFDGGKGFGDINDPSVGGLLADLY